MKGVKLTYKNSIKLLNRALEIESKMQDMVDRQIAQSHEELRKRINQQILDLANERGCSLWDICFNYIPDIEYDCEFKEIDGMRNKYVVTGRVALIPMRFEFDKEDEE